jgi:hypothetical protein
MSLPLVTVLHKLQKQIQELAPVLELFVEQTIQPSVKDCERLQEQLNQLQESVAVYKYNMIETELSPSFSIHARISEIEPPAAEETTKPLPKKEEKIPAAQASFEKPDGEPAKAVKPLSVSLNDKFRFINELFSQNNSEYNIALEQLSGLSNWNDTEIYLNSLKSLYGWKDNHEVVKHLYSLSKNRFE